MAAPYTPEEDTQFLNQLQLQLEQERQSQAASGQMMMPQTAFQQQQKQNLVEWQLDFRQELEDFEHFLRSDVLQRDNKGNEYWIRNPDANQIIMNDRGVNEILKQIRTFLNKNNVLSNYSADEIRDRIRRLGHALRKLIYRNMEDYGLDTEYKINHFEMMTIDLISMIESSYRRAMGGEERRGLNETRFVQQNDNGLNQQAMMPGMYQPQKKRSLINPFTWFG